MLVIQIALGIVLGLFLIAYLDKVLKFLGGAALILFALAALAVTYSLLTSDGAQAAISSLQWMDIVVGLGVMVAGILGFMGMSALSTMGSRRFLLTDGESVAALVILSFLSYMGFLVWYEYHKNGWISIEPTLAAVFGSFLIGCLVIIAKRGRGRLKAQQRVKETASEAHPEALASKDES